jgi:hypothetical protein
MMERQETLMKRMASVRPRQVALAKEQSRKNQEQKSMPAQKRKPAAKPRPPKR